MTLHLTLLISFLVATEFASVDVFHCQFKTYDLLMQIKLIDNQALYEGVSAASENAFQRN